MVVRGLSHWSSPRNQSGNCRDREAVQDFSDHWSVTSVLNFPVRIVRCFNLSIKKASGPTLSVLAFDLQNGSPKFLFDLYGKVEAFLSELHLQAAEKNIQINPPNWALKHTKSLIWWVMILMAGQQALVWASSGFFGVQNIDTVCQTLEAIGCVLNWRCLWFREHFKV